MSIEKINCWSVDLTSHATYYMADGKTCDTVQTIVVELVTDTGLSGWGEVCPIPHYLPAYAEGVIPAIGYMSPVLLGADPVGPEALMYQLDSWLQGHPYAKSAIDTALWDLSAKTAGLPLYALLGGRCQTDLALYHSITCVDADEMAAIASEAYASGIRQFQCKLGADADWKKDVERLIKVRETVGEGPLVYGDWNCGATRLHATRVGRAVRDLDVMLEQPCESLESCAAVRESSGLAMKIDENAHDTDSLLKAWKLGCMDAVALKLSKFGGLSRMRRARDLCMHIGAKMCIEDTWGSDITTAAALHLATATPSSHVLNVCDLSGYVYPRIDPAAPTRENGSISAITSDLNKTGLGVEPDRSVLGNPSRVIA